MQPARIALATLAVVLSACAAVSPPPASPKPAPRVAQTSPTPAREPVALESPAPQPPTRLEESGIGDALPPPPAPEVVAALPPEAAPPALAAESLTGLIKPTTPPNVAAALRLIEEGRQEMNRANYEPALERFERGVTIDPTNAYGYYFLAQLHYLKKNYDQAIAFASRAAALSARTDRIWLARAYSLQGAAFEDVGRYPDARKAYQKAVEADPDNLPARVGVARLNPE